MDEKAMTTQEVAKFLNISNQMVYNLIKQEMITSFKVGSSVRILYGDLLNYIDRQKTVSGAVHMKYGNSDLGAFSLRNVCSHLGSFALSGINFDFPLGKTISFVGPSGSGKTLLLRSIAGIETLDAGAVFVGPTRIDAMTVGARRIGYVFQENTLYPHMDSSENIGFPQTMRKMSKTQIEDEVARIVEKLQIPAQYLPKTPDALPEGIKQLVAIAHAQSNAMDVYLMDEPMSCLDITIKKGMRVFLKALVTDLGKTTIYAFNDPEDALALSDYVGVLDQGRLVQAGPVREVYERPLCPIALEALSVYGTVRIPVEVKSHITFPLSLPSEKEDGVYTLYFRPDELEVLPSSGAAKAGPSGPSGAISAEILSSRFIDGSHMTAKCLLDGTIQADLILPPDTKKIFLMKARHLYFFPA